MFVVELAFGDDPERLEARGAHRQLLERLHAEGALVMAGPFADDSGALLIFDVADADGLAKIIDQDPYYGTAGVTVVRRQEYTPIVR